MRLNLTEIKNAFLEPAILRLSELGFERFKKSEYFVKPASEFNHVIRFIFVRSRNASYGVTIGFSLGIRVNKFAKIFNEICYSQEIKDTLGYKLDATPQFEINNIRLTKRGSHFIEKIDDVPQTASSILESIQEYGIEYLNQTSSYSEMFQIFWGSDELPIRPFVTPLSRFVLLSLMNTQINSGKEYEIIAEKIIFKARQEIENFNPNSFELLNSEIQKLKSSADSYANWWKDT
jgi:hypothetical protein